MKAVWPWVNHVTSLNLSSFISKMKTLNYTLGLYFVLRPVGFIDNWDFVTCNKLWKQTVI